MKVCSTSSIDILILRICFDFDSMGFGFVGFKFGGENLFSCYLLV